MKTKLFLFMFGIFLIAGFNTIHAQSIIANGDFESWTAGAPDSWTTIDAGITVTEENTIKHGGAASANVNVTTGSQASTDFRF